MGAGAWVWWIAGGGMGAAGLALLVWALLWDHSRGRRRCGRCWYDMSATPGLVCPECGRSARRERALFRTRRRWGWAAAAMVAVAGGGVLALMPALRTEVWRRYVPDTVLIWLLPRGSEVSPKLWMEMNRRMLADEPACGAAWYAQLASWQRGMLVRRARLAIERRESPHAFNHGCFALFLAGEDAAGHAEFLLGLLRHPDGQTRVSAAGVLRRIPSVTDRFVAAVSEAVESTDDNSAGNLLNQLADPLKREPGRADARELLLRHAVHSARPITRTCALQMLRHTEQTPETLAALRGAVTAADLPDEGNRLAAASTLMAVDPDSVESRAAVVEGLRRTIGTEAEYSMADRVVRRWPRDAGVIGLWADVLSRQAPDRVAWSVRACFNDLPAAERALVLADLLRFAHLRGEAARALGELGAGAAPALPALRAAMEGVGEEERVLIERAMKSIEQKAGTGG